MAALLQQAQAEGLCLHYPENLGQHREVSLESAVNMLLRALGTAQNTAFHWRYIDKPLDGQLALIFISPQAPFPNDGIRYQEAEVNYTMNAGSGRELEVSEAKSGFIPGSQDQNAWRLRRRYRLLKGGHPQLVLVHYTRGPPTPIIPSLMNQPIRAYPLRTVAEPPTYVLGDKAGHKAFPPGTSMQQPPPPPSSASAGSAPGIPMNFNHPVSAAAQAALLNQQNNAMEQLERRREREREKERTRERSGSTSGRPGHNVADDGSDDETEQISTRALALARYKRNHDFMNNVFRQAAFGDKTAPVRPSPYSIFSKEELEAKTASLQADIDQLRRQAAERQSLRDSAEQRLQALPDVSMGREPLSA